MLTTLCSNAIQQRKQKLYIPSEEPGAYMVRILECLQNLNAASIYFKNISYLIIIRSFNIFSKCHSTFIITIHFFFFVLSTIIYRKSSLLTILGKMKFIIMPYIPLSVVLLGPHRTSVSKLPSNSSWHTSEKGVLSFSGRGFWGDHSHYYCDLKPALLSCHKFPTQTGVILA